MAHSLDAKVEARLVYTRTGSHVQTLAELKKKDYFVPRSTYMSWYKQDKEGWKEERREFVRAYAREQARLENVEKKAISTFELLLSALSDKALEKLKNGEELTREEVLSLRDAAAQLVKMKRSEQDKFNFENKEVQAIISVLMRHPQIAPILKRDKARIIADCEKEMKK